MIPANAKRRLSVIGGKCNASSLWLLNSEISTAFVSLIGPPKRRADYKRRDDFPFVSGYFGYACGL